MSKFEIEVYNRGVGVREFSIEPFNPDRVYGRINSFDCGDSSINRFVNKRSFARRVKDSFSQVYALLESGERFMGFYTLETFAIVVDEVEPIKSIPVMRLGLLAIDKYRKRVGLGRRLLKDALFRVYEISKLVDCRGLYLEANYSSIQFYEELGFVALSDVKEGEPLPMFLSIDTISELF